MSDYSQGKIYMLTSKQTPKVYIGSTKLTLKERLSTHICQYKDWLKEKSNYITSFEILQYDDYEIHLIEDYPCETRKELKLKEGEYQRMMDCVNKNIAGRTNKEWVIDNKEYWKEYRKNNKKHLNEYMKEYNKKNKEILLQYQKEYRKEYDLRPEVKEKLKEYRKEYKFRPEVKERRNQKIICICSGTYSKINKAKHYKTRKHIQYIEEMKEKGDPTNINECIEQITSTS